MCKVEGTRTHCACKDTRCANRHDFVDKDLNGIESRQHGHGWELVIIKDLCPEGVQLIGEGKMNWADGSSRKVDRFVSHGGIGVNWVYQPPSMGRPARICDECRALGHSVAG
jgi:hypothetical protein